MCARAQMHRRHREGFAAKFPDPLLAAGDAVMSKSKSLPSTSLRVTDSRGIWDENKTKHVYDKF